MEHPPSEKNLELERLVFFSDAVVAIAITLLALDLKIEEVSDGHLTFADIGHAWKKFAAFFLSFLTIAIFWKIHHEFFHYIKRIDARMLFFNLGWLLFIVVLPFATTLVSSYFFDTAAVFTYSLIVLCISFFQNFIWDYVTEKPELIKDTLTDEISREYRLACNIAMINAIVAMIISFISPVFAFISLFTRIIMFHRSAIQYQTARIERRKKKR